MSGVHLIVNPIAGNGAAKAAFAAAEQELKRLNVPYTAVQSEYPGHAVELARQALETGADRVVAVGGDGTVREVASALHGTEATLGIIPCGTGNDIVRPLGISLNPAEAVLTLLEGRRRHMDAAMVNGELFFNVMGFGFDVDVLDFTEIYKTRTKNGSWAYIRGLLHALRVLRLRKLTMTLPDGRQIVKDRCLIVAVGNGTHFGGGMKVTPEADPFDGLLDVCIGFDVKMPGILPLLVKFIKGRHVGLTKHIEYFKTTGLTAECDPVSRIDMDGEVIPSTPVTVSVLPASLWVLVP